MNCQEARDLVELALDRNLSSGVKRRLDLHLLRCEGCRAFFAAEHAEHQRWFRAINSPDEPRHSLPPDFADRLAAAVVARSAMRRPFFMLRPRWALLAASLVLMVGFVFAAVVGIRGVEAANQGDEAGGEGPNALEGTQATEGTKATAVSSADAVTVTSVPIVPSAASAPTTSYQLESNQGEPTMKKGKAAVAALTAAMAAAPLAAANGDEYQFIISGEVVAATTGCSSDSSATTALTSGPLADGVVYGSELEARYRTMGESGTCSLRSDKAGIVISFR